MLNQPTNEARFMSLDCKCECNNEWNVIIANYYFMPTCPKCDKNAWAMKWGGFTEFPTPPDKDL